MVRRPPAKDREYRLLWPRWLFGDELAELLEDQRLDDLAKSVELLFGEAFAGPRPVEDLRTGYSDDYRFTSGPVTEYARELLENIDLLQPHQPRRYWYERMNPAGAPQAPEGETERQTELRRGWNTLIGELDEHGYLDRSFGPDDTGREARIADHLTAQGGGIPGYLFWPPSEKASDLGVETDSSTRLSRSFTTRWRDREAEHSPARHATSATSHLRPAKPSTAGGSMSYSTRLRIPLQLASGWRRRRPLVRSVPDPRRELVATVRTAPDGNQDKIDHAIALFRSRSAAVEDKRSACAALADVLEVRRNSVLAKTLTKKDEVDLFLIANKFAIRHHQADQQQDYDPAFLDWIFWCYLAAVELSNRLLTRESPDDDD